MVLQFLTGTWLNLFTTFPGTQSSSVAGAFSAMMTSSMATVHLLVGVFLVVLAMAILAILIDSGETRLVVFPVVGLAFIVLSALSGTEFASSGFQDSAYSYLMAIGFITAFSSYTALVALHGIETRSGSLLKSS